MKMLYKFFMNIYHNKGEKKVKKINVMYQLLYEDSSGRKGAIGNEWVKAEDEAKAIEECKKKCGERYKNIINYDSIEVCKK